MNAMTRIGMDSQAQGRAAGRPVAGSACLQAAELELGARPPVRRLVPMPGRASGTSAISARRPVSAGRVGYELILLVPDARAGTKHQCDQRPTHQCDQRPTPGVRRQSRL